MDSPELIPSRMTFFNNAENGYTVPLRYQTQNSKEVYPHEIDFFFAYWLKSHGFHFELVESLEVAGDWRAFRNN